MAYFRRLTALPRRGAYRLVASFVVAALLPGCRTSDDLSFAPPGTQQLRLWTPFREHQKVESTNDLGLRGRSATAVDFGLGLEYERWLAHTQSFTAGVSYMDMSVPLGSSFDGTLISAHAGGRAYALLGHQPFALYLQYGLKAGFQSTRANALAIELGGGVATRVSPDIAIELGFVHELPVLDGDNTSAPFSVVGDEFSWDGFVWRLGVSLFL